MHRSSACSSAARLSALSLTRRWSAVDLSRVHRSSVSSSFCWSAAFLSLVLPLLCLFVRHWSLTGPSLVCLLVSLCSVTYPSLPRLLGSWSLTCLLVSYLSLLCRCSVAPLPDRPSGRASLVHLIVRLVVHRWSAALLLHSAALLLHSAALLLHSAALLLHLAARLHSTRLLYYSTPLGCSTTPLHSPCVHSYSICWLSLAATLFTHTLFHAWCPVTLLSLIRCSTVVVTAAASCRRARDSIARCVVAARLPPSATSVTVPTDCSFLAVQCLNAVQCTALHSIAQQHTRAFKRWFLCRSLVLLESFEHRSGS